MIDTIDTIDTCEFKKAPKSGVDGALGIDTIDTGDRHRGSPHRYARATPAVRDAAGVVCSRSEYGAVGLAGGAASTMVRRGG